MRQLHHIARWHLIRCSWPQHFPGIRCAPSGLVHGSSCFALYENSSVTHHIMVGSLRPTHAGNANVCWQIRSAGSIICQAAQCGRDARDPRSNTRAPATASAPKLARRSVTSRVFSTGVMVSFKPVLLRRVLARVSGVADGSARCSRRGTQPRRGVARRRCSGRACGLADAGKVRISGGRINPVRRPILYHTLAGVGHLPLRAFAR